MFSGGFELAPNGLGANSEANVRQTAQPSIPAALPLVAAASSLLQIEERLAPVAEEVAHGIGLVGNEFELGGGS